MSPSLRLVIHTPNISISSVQLLSCVWLFVTPWTTAHQASLSITNSRSSLKLMSIESVMPPNHLILCLQSFPASASFQMSLLFASGGQSIGVSTSTSVLPMNTQDWSPLGRTGWISLQSKGLSSVFSDTMEVHNRTSLSLLQGTLFSQKGPRSKTPMINLIWKSVYILHYYSEISNHIKISNI